jgi:hypothetical protein
MPCKICEKRRPRRFCPGVRGDICTLCCGSEREVTVDCPLDCEYLQDAHLHERVQPPDPDQFPNRDIRISDQFLRENERALTFMAAALLQASTRAGAVDYDVRDALESLVRTFRTRESGLYYDTRPSNPVAAFIYQTVQELIERVRSEAAQHGALSSIRDADLLGIFAFLQRLELRYNNGRKRGRAFLGFLQQQFSPTGEAPPAPSLVLP